MTAGSDQAPVATADRKGQRGRWILWGLGGIGAFAAMGVPMIAVTFFMGQMTESMARMVISVDRMSKDVSVMKDNLVAMGDYMNSITIGVTSMDGNIDDIEASIVAMDFNINTINGAIQTIQASMASDLSAMSTDVGDLNTADAIIVDRLLVSWYLDYLAEEGKRNTEVEFHDMFESVAHEFICRSQEIAEQFSAGLHQVLSDGALEGILANYADVTADTVLVPLAGHLADSDRTRTQSGAPDTTQ